MKHVDNVEVELLDLRDYPMPFFDDATSPSVRDGLPNNDAAAAWAKKIADADGFIVIAPEYNHGYPGVLKNAFDWVYKEWNRKAISFVGYGSAMGARSVEQLREVAVELQMAPVRAAVHIPWGSMQEARQNPAALAQYDASAQTMIDNLVWWARALKNARQ